MLGVNDSTGTVVIDTYTFLINSVILRKGGERYEEALALWDQAQKTFPKYANIYSHKGALLYKMKRREEAMKMLEIAVKSGIQIADSYYYLGICYLEGVGGRQRDRGEVRRLLTKALQFDPKHSEAATALRKL